MALPPVARLWALLSITALLCGMATAQTGPSLPIVYCAGVNTASMAPFNSNYQSEGRCHDNCTTANFALAIVQASSCWCSNLIPNKADQKPLKDCQNPCPGYPTDICGGDGTYGYIQLKDPSGTAVAGATNTVSSTSAVVTTSTETVQKTVQNTVTLPPAVTLSLSSPTTSGLDSPTTPPPNDSPSATLGPTVQTVTVGGVIKTVTATPSTTAGAPELTSTEDHGSSGLSTGATVGIAVSIVGVFAIGAIFFFMWYLKRKKNEGSEGGGLFTSSRRGSSPGMSGTPKTGEVSETRFGEGPTMAATWDVGGPSKRRSHLMPIDPRLQPFGKGIYAGDQNKSHDSIGSLQDHQDYTRRIQETPRVLRAVNPDPDV